MFVYAIKAFSELSNLELYGILKLRTDIFVVEQICPYPELDGKDLHAHHVIARLKAGDYVGTLRIFWEEETVGLCTIGRVAVASSHRGRNYGRIILQHAIDFCKSELKARKIHISAQAYLTKFYEEFGFEQVSEVYQEDGIDHVSMYLNLSNEKN